MQEHIQQLKKMYTETNDPYRCSALKAAMEAVRKQIPQKCECDGHYYPCPRCGNPLADETGDWCPYCGQKYIK